MNPTHSILLSQMTFDGIAPSKQDELDDTVMYIGRCTPDCTGENDNKWLIMKKVVTGTETTILFANGKKLYNQAWSNRLTLKYKIGENFAEFTETPSAS